MDIAVITGSAGLVGSEATRVFAKHGLKIIGIDNDMRKYFFGDTASTSWNKEKLMHDIDNYIHKDIDIRNQQEIDLLFKEYGKDIKLIIHSAGQPSHDWAAKEPVTDFCVNANGTLNLLEAARLNAPNAVFIFTSTNKVYGDLPNSLPVVELETRWELPIGHQHFTGIDETMSIDQSMHSLFGASKIAADILVQEYGKYFGMKTACFRCGCLTGPNHSSAELHGFLAYLMKCFMTNSQYKIFGYKGKQVRDNIHSKDLVNAFYEFYKAPRIGEVYNIGGGRQNSCSILEAIKICEEITSLKLNHSYINENRKGDHIWYISKLDKFQEHFPDWQIRYGLYETLIQIYDNNITKWLPE